ncbi:S8 family serine peptidase [Actinoplanes sp. KI2]|uniref:S8 family serine peptidase n=1 Tax=Actinoplanes sp. KI2 TaxID=2983315 RepID=UPI0021D58E96|nr:S8 family serine peptidase [Actinoplanes sp. KI2]MCU7722969.1 S8 family serine peptidase [Actinoplanes sp. KI2]
MAPAVPASAAPALESVVVRLRTQVDPSGIHGRSRHERQAALVRALRARAGADQPGLLGLLRRRKAQRLVTDVTPLWVVNAVAVTAAPSVVREMAARPEVARIDPDVVAATVPAQPNVAAVGAPALWELGLTGQGAVVGIMDTGVDVTHPDLAASWRGGADSWYDPNGQHPTDPTDVSGHGTATAGVIVGATTGVAPGASWIGVKVFNDRGTASTSAIHKGFQWLLDPDGNPATADAPDVVNASWTGSAAGCSLEFQPDLRNLRAAGILPVFSAGNYGGAAGTVLSPANLPEALAVGSVDNTGLVDPSSSRGPSACDQRVEPRVVAPGVGIHTTDLYGGYLDATGTSVAAPHVTGVAALLLGAYPDLNVDRLQSALESTADDLGAPGPDNAYGYGRVDAPAALQWLATAPDFTVAVAPSAPAVAPGGSATLAVTVTPVNGFAAGVTLALAGLPAQASATITGTTRIAITTTAAIAPGTYPLILTATGGGLTRTAYARLTVTTPPGFAMTASPASVTVTRGQTATYTVATSSIGNFTGPVTLKVTGATATITPNPVATPGSATLRVTTTTRGTFTLTVTGTAGTIQHQATVTLTVR